MNLLLVLLALALSLLLACGWEDDPGPDDDDDPEGDCMKFHYCYGLYQVGYCMRRKGHDGEHLCAKCYTYFSDEDEE